MPITTSEQQTFELAGLTAKKISNGGVVCLFGNLGTGKTIFTKGIANHLGINKFSIKSPTYTYIRHHKAKNGNNFYHIDLYRLDEIDELLLQEINELLEEKSNIIVIEWSERMINNLPKKRTEVRFAYIDEFKRKIDFKENK